MTREDPCVSISLTSPVSQTAVKEIKQRLFDIYTEEPRPIKPHVVNTVK
jgi:hypothetical protein